MAFCESCAAQISDQAAMCPQCGHPQPGAVGTAPPAGRRTEGLAIASLVLGIAGFVVCPLVCSILAVVFGNQAKTKIAQDPSLEGEGMANAGVILGWIGIALTAILIFIFIAAVGASAATLAFP